MEQQEEASFLTTFDGDFGKAIQYLLEQQSVAHFQISDLYWQNYRLIANQNLLIEENKQKANQIELLRLEIASLKKKKDEDDNGYFASDEESQSSDSEE